MKKNNRLNSSFYSFCNFKLIFSKLAFDQFRFLLCLALFLSGCAVRGLRTEIQNSPLVKLSGPNVYVEVFSSDGKQITGPTADTIKDEAYKTLAEKGYVQAPTLADAHTSIGFFLGTRVRDVQVPGQTYLIPSYQPGQQTTYRFRNQYGQTATGTATSQGTTQWQTGYREGYNTSVTDQWIMVYGYVQKYGSRRVQTFQGQTYQTKEKVNLLSNNKAIRSAVHKLMSTSSLFEVDHAPAASSSDRPGCRPIIGLDINYEKLNADKTAIVTTIVPKSSAELAGIKPGDQIESIEGLDYTDFFSNPERTDEFYKKDSLRVVVTRNSKTKNLDVKPKIECPL